MKNRPLVAACLAASLNTACATVLARDRQMVSVTSDLPGAEVQVNGVPLGKTPVQVPLDASTDHTIVVKVGSTVHTCVLSATIKPEWIVLDVVMGGVPVIVDAVTGKWRSLDSNFCHAAMPGAAVGRGEPAERAPAQGGSLLGDIVAEDDEDEGEQRDEAAGPAARPPAAALSLRPVVTPASIRRPDVRLADELDIEIEGERDERDEPRGRRDDERRARRDEEDRDRDGDRDRRDRDEQRDDELAPRAAARLDRDETPRRVESRPRRSSERSRSRRSPARRRDAACACDRSR
jgi:hypothetical protein